MPHVSVVMPVLNGGPFFQTAIASVLAQTYGDLELLIVDDGSTDGSAELAESFGDARIVVIRNRRRAGVSAALNIGLRRATGELVARLDADDVAHPSRLARQVELLRSDPRLAVVGSQARLVDENGALIGAVTRPCDDVAIRWFHQFDNPFIHSAVMFRTREIRDGLGGYDESLQLVEDWDLWGRALIHHGAYNLPEPLVDYRFSQRSVIGAVHASPAPARRARLETTVRLLVARHVAQTLGDDVLNDGELTLMAGFLLDVDAATLDTFLALLDRLLDRFIARHPDARRSADFKRTLAWQLDTIAYRVTPASRRSALRVYRKALSHGPGVARFVPWSRALTLAVLGRSGRDRLRHLRNANLTKIA